MTKNEVKQNFVPKICSIRPCMLKIICLETSIHPPYML